MPAVKLAAPKGTIRIVEDASTGELYVFGVDANGEVTGNPAIGFRDHGQGIEASRFDNPGAPFKLAADGRINITGLTP